MAHAPALMWDTLVLTDPNGAPRPQPVEGGWVRTRDTQQPCCRAWLTPPSMRASSLLPVHLPSGMFLGPVQEIEHTNRFTSVLVPISEGAEAPFLAWVNIWSSRNASNVRRGVAFAHIVPRSETDEWRRWGWGDVYLAAGVRGVLPRNRRR